MSKHITAEATPGSGDTIPFELTGSGRPGMGSFETVLERNREFAAAGGHEGAVVFPNALFVVTCLDPRVDPAHILGLRLSDAIVVRNGGGRVTPEVINDVAFVGQLAGNLLPRRAAVRGRRDSPHPVWDWGAADDGFRHRYAERIGADEAELRDRAVLDPAATVASDVERPLRSSDLQAGHGLRPRLRRRHGAGADDRPSRSWLKFRLEQPLDDAATEPCVAASARTRPVQAVVPWPSRKFGTWPSPRPNSTRTCGRRPRCSACSVALDAAERARISEH